MSSGNQIKSSYEIENASTSFVHMIENGIGY